MARGLVEAFCRNRPGRRRWPDRAGLFTYAGGPAFPPRGTAVAGHAANLAINPAVDPTAGRQLSPHLRDGGINGANYIYNATGAASLHRPPDAGSTDAINAARPSIPRSGSAPATSLSSFGTASVSWLEDQRKTASTQSTTRTPLLSRATDALSNVAGVNIDDEYATQLQLEQSYAASSKLINVDQPALRHAAQRGGLTMRTGFISTLSLVSLAAQFDISRMQSELVQAQHGSHHQPTCRCRPVLGATADAACGFISISPRSTC